MSGRPVLVIKLGALGDFLLALGPMQAIRAQHADAELVLLTRPRFRDLAVQSGLFDTIWEDPAPRWDPLAWLALRRRLRGAGFGRVYDLQTSDRTDFYLRLFWPGPWPEWSGTARGASHRHVYPRRHRMHTVDRQRAQLALAGIDSVPPPDLGFLGTGPAPAGIDGRFALLVPGSAPDRPEKRWPADDYARVARALEEHGLRPVLIGTAAEAGSLAAIAGQVPAAIDLGGSTDLDQLASLGRQATVAIGNDTGPVHLLAMAGCPTVALFSDASDPRKTGPRGPAVRILQAAPDAPVTVPQVLQAVMEICRPATKPAVDRSGS